MELIQPLRGLRPNKKYVSEVIAPPYDVLSSAEARVRSQNKPWSFLHISKPEIDLPVAIDPYSSQVYQQGRQNFLRMQQEGVLEQDNQPCYYVYRLKMGPHQQTGLVAAASAEAYAQNRIRKHELTQPVKVTDRINQIEALQAQTGPVLLAYRSQQRVDQLLFDVTKTSPEYDVTADDGIQHQLWVVKDPQLINELTEYFTKMDNLYIADGHHRSEAASQLTIKHSNKPWQYFLSVIFPDNQLQILGYHRVIKDLNGHTANDFINKLKDIFTVEKSVQATTPRRPNEFAMYLDKQWYSLNLPASKIPANDSVAALDVSLLTQHVLVPLLNITDQRRDPRIEFVGGIRGLPELARRVDSGEMAVAFALHPTRMLDIMQVADAGQIMPPKSTWFEPKLADGMVSHLLND